MEGVQHRTGPNGEEVTTAIVQQQQHLPLHESVRSVLLAIVVALLLFIGGQVMHTANSTARLEERTTMMMSDLEGLRAYLRSQSLNEQQRQR